MPTEEIFILGQVSHFPMVASTCTKAILDQRRGKLLAYASVPGVSYLRRLVSCRLYDKLELFMPEQVFLDNQDSITSFVVHILKGIEQFLLPKRIVITVTQDLQFHVQIDDLAGTFPLSDIISAHNLIVGQIVKRFAEEVQPFALLFISKASAVINIILISNGELDFSLTSFPLTKCLTENVLLLGERYRNSPLNNEVHVDCLLAILFNLAVMVTNPFHLTAVQSGLAGIADSDITIKTVPPLTRLSKCLWMITDPAFNPVLKYKGLRSMTSLANAHQFSASLIGLYINDLIETGFCNPEVAYDKILLGCINLKEQINER